MNTVHRGFGKLRRRTANDAHIDVLMKDYDDADKMLARIIEASKAWRDAWVSILSTQMQFAAEFDALYQPIIGAGDSYNGPEHVDTPPEVMERANKLKETYEELRTDLLEEVNMVDGRIIKPAMEAKDYIQPLKKVMKKRDDRKLDFERYTRNVDSGRKKLRRSDRENAALAKNEKELVRATEEFNAADENLRSTLPPLLTAAFSILPHLLAAQVMTQNTLLAQYYTTLHNYCQDEGFPSEPPSMREVISAWDEVFKPVQQELESNIGIIATGKAVKQPMKLEDQRQGSTLTGLNIRNGITQRRAGSQPAIQRGPHPPSPNMQALPAPPSPSPTSKPKPSPSPSSNTSTALTALLSPPADAQSTTPSEHHTPGTGGHHSPAAPRPDYFTRDRVPSSTSIASAVAKKKPPPPPPPHKPKRGDGNNTLWVTALYSFDGQSAGDLAFREGDRIRVVKKTESTEDWWEGELRGATGSFPANYCKVA
ncbi:MAG: hypothetical protein M1825_001368 [Sarcosagium campestre]|nr:MAG: hypothetical protein M1825_001368 [Sarcosagium campestre]